VIHVIRINERKCLQLGVAGNKKDGKDVIKTLAGCQGHFEKN
jgi:hypothetical protein